MVVTRKNIVSLFVGGTLLSLLFNPISKILDIPHQSCMFTSILISGIIGIIAFFPSYRGIYRLNILDLIFTVLALSGICFYHPDSDLFGLARFSLIILYWSIRQTGGLNILFLYVTTLISILILSTWGYLQIWQIIPSNHTYFNLTGPYSNPTVYAGVLCLLISVPIIVLFHLPQNNIPKLFYYWNILTCLLALPILCFTQCRSAWIALLAIIGYAIYRRIQLSFYVKAGIVLSSIFIVCWLYQYKSDSADGRLLIWKVTAQMIKEKPLKGFGPHGFTANYMNYQADYLRTKGTPRDKQLADNNHYVYNEPLRWMVEYGIVGLLLYFSLIYIIFSLRKNSVHSRCIKALGIAGITWGSFSYPDQTFPILVIMVIAMAEMSNLQKKYIIKKIPTWSWHTLLQFPIFIAIIGQSFLLIKMYQHHHQLFQVVQNDNRPKSEQILTEFTQLKTVLKNEKIFWMYYCHILHRLQKDTVLLENIYHWEYLHPSTHTYILKGDALQRLGKIKEAEKAYWTAHYMVPSRQKARYKLVLLYQSQGRTSDAYRLAYEILTEKVKVYGFETYEMHRDLERIFENQLNNYSLKN